MKWILKELAFTYLAKKQQQQHHQQQQQPNLYQIINHCLDEKLSEQLIYFISIAQQTENVV